MLEGVLFVLGQDEHSAAGKPVLPSTIFVVQSG